MSDEQRLKDIEEFLKNENIDVDNTILKENHEEKVQKQPRQQEEEVDNLTDFEKEQMAKGWNPKGEKSADEWARTEPLYDEIKARGKEIKRMQRTIKAMQEHMQKQEQIAYEKALKDLESQRNNAIRSGDINLVQEIDKSKESLATQFNDIPFLDDKEPEAVHDFKERHSSWMNGTSYEEMNMQQWLLQRDNALASKNLPPEEHMRVLEEHLYKQFPDFFKRNNQEPDQYVESGSYDVDTSKQVNKKVGFRDLSQSQKQIAKDFERMGVMSVDEYIKQLSALGELNKK